MEAPKRPGRPRKSEAERLSEIARFRVTAEELDTLYREALKARLPLSVHLRTLFLLRSTKNTEDMN